MFFRNYSVVSVWYTENGGMTWADVSGNLEQNADGSGDGPSVRTALIVTHGATPYYLVGTSTGLYSTTTLNGSSTEWALEGSAMIGNVVVDALAAEILTALWSRGPTGMAYSVQLYHRKPCRQ